MKSASESGWVGSGRVWFNSVRIGLIWGVDCRNDSHDESRVTSGGGPSVAHTHTHFKQRITTVVSSLCKGVCFAHVQGERMVEDLEGSLDLRVY